MLQSEVFLKKLAHYFFLAIEYVKSLQNIVILEYLLFSREGICSTAIVSNTKDLVEPVYDSTIVHGHLLSLDIALFIQMEHRQ